MNQDNYITLIYKKLKKEITSDEQADLDHWVEKEATNAQLQQQLEENWQASNTALPPIEIDAKKDFQGFKKRMQAHKSAATAPKTAKIRSINSRRRLLSIAAAIAIPLMAAIWLFRPSPATTMLVAQTTSGETKSIELNDGTMVTLNENSELKYPATFAATDRQVQLSGEGFFEVAKDATRPFEVQLERASVKVLGTVFNVRSLANESEIKVNVEEGKVQFSSTHIGKGVILTAGEEGTYDLTANQITEKKVNNKNASAWKTASLTYKNELLSTVVSDLAKHFKVKVTVTNEVMQNCRVTARFADVTAKDVLNYIVEVYQMDLKEIDGQTFELGGGKCE